MCDGIPGDGIDEEQPNLPIETELMNMMGKELEVLHSLHPYTQPGLWDEAVENVRAIRTAIHIHRSQVIRKSLVGN